MWFLTPSVIRASKLLTSGFFSKLEFTNKSTVLKYAHTVSFPPRLASPTCSREQSPLHTHENSKDSTTGAPERLPRIVSGYLNCKSQPRDLNLSNLGYVPSSRASLHESSSISQFLRQFSSSICIIPQEFLREHLQSVAISYYKVLRVLTNTNWHCHHSSENWWPISNAYYLVAY